MELQKIMFGAQNASHEVVVRFMGHNRSLWEGSEKECDEFIKACRINRGGDK